MYKLMVVIFLSWISLSSASNYYVDKNATGNNTGTNWNDAWQSFANVDWNQIQPGDTIFISGGITSKTYLNQSIEPEVSGTLGNQIVITKGLESGHNGEVILDGNNNTENAFIISGSPRHYVTFEYATIKNYTSNGYIYVQTSESSKSKGLVFNYLNIQEVTAKAMRLKHMDGGIVSHCTITTSSYSSGQTDGIYIQDGIGNTIEYCDIRITNSNPSPHCDAMQIDGETSGTIRFNYVESSSGKTSNAQGIYIANYSGGSFKVYGNVIKCDDVNTSYQLAWRYPETGSDDYIFIYNNTFIGGSSNYHLIYIQPGSDSKCEVKNNIFFSNYNDHIVEYASSIPASNVNHNLYFTAGNDIVKWDTDYAWSEWQSAGGDLDGYNSNPLFNNPGIGDYTLTAVSQAVDNGIELGSPYNIDKNGISKPQGEGWDIGAYEFNNGRDITPPSVVAAALLDSVSLVITFSEPIEESGAENIGNYLIDNGILISNAALSVSMKQVTLSTSEHSTGIIYQVIVSNISDLAGNLISQDNSAYYEFENVTGGDLMNLNIIEATANDWFQDFTPDRAIDHQGLFQNPSSRWNGAIPMPDEIVFDLGSRKSIVKTRISFFRWNVGRIYEYSIFISNDGSSWTPAIENVYSTLDEWIEVEFNPVDGRYVKVISLSNNESEWAGMYEAEIWGYNEPSTAGEIDPQPNEFYLSQNFPNPFNPSTNIKFDLPESSKIRISVFNILGEQLYVLTNKEYESGTHIILFDAKELTSGIYFYRLETEKFVDTKKMILLR